ncbi:MULTISPECIES: hypothetical protein [Sphingobacterium]|uniref:hypothetical protein n=1 Tax=Sphingobacterium TaxID=28453 RepID=UPI00257E9F6D|nr:MULTISPECIES: hypothetical protein [Sphingobacterium]
MEELLKSIAPELMTATAGAFIGWFFQRKKQNADLRASEIENAEKALQYYRIMVGDLGEQLTEAITELRATKLTVKDLEERVEGLTNELKKYKQLNGKVL